MKTIIGIHNIGNGTCAFSNKTGDGATVTFGNGLIKEKFLTWSSLRKLAGLQFGGNDADRQDGKPETEAQSG